ncbi:hypothetical protein [Streptomyces anulatus]|uniref:hypothetical protein n=1 Tax=Streptomyces anulatus TaxID=1892 RepID=UPI003669BD9B
MADIENTPETPQEPALSPLEAPEVESIPEIGSIPETGTGGPSLDDLRAQVEQASASLRTSEDLRQQLNSQLDDSEARVQAAEIALQRERVGRKHGLPDELMGFLRGETADALEAEAATLAKFAVSNYGYLGTGGLDPTDEDSDGVVGRILRKSREF